MLLYNNQKPQNQERIKTWWKGATISDDRVVDDTFLKSTDEKCWPLYTLCCQPKINIKEKTAFSRWSQAFLATSTLRNRRKQSQSLDPQFISKERAIYDKHPSKKINTWTIEKYTPVRSISLPRWLPVLNWRSINVLTIDHIYLLPI